MPAETRTYGLDHVVEQTGAPSERWIRELLNAGRIPGRKAGRQWRMTESDIAALVDYMARPARTPASAGFDSSLVAAHPSPAPKVPALTARAQRNLHRQSS